MDTTSHSCMNWFRLSVHALMVISAHMSISPRCSSSLVAQELKSHATFVRRILAHLVQAEIIEAREGRDGGYRLLRPADQISLADLYQIAHRAYLLENVEKSSEKPNPFQRLMLDIGEDIESVLLERLRPHTVASQLAEYRAFAQA